jgi:predicted dehydrogenase
MNAAGRAAAALPGGHVEGFGDTFGALFRAIYADVLAGRPSPNPPYATFAAGHDEMLVNDAVAESARTGRWVDVARASSPTPPVAASA